MNTDGIEDIYGLSPLQQGMLFHSQYEPQSRLYFEQVAVAFEAHVDMNAFTTSWTRVGEANTALRTSFHWEESDKPVQVVHRRASIPVERLDLSAVAAPDRDQAVQSVVDADRARGFDLQRAPLLRVTLIRIAPNSYRMLLSFHHIILDGWSLQTVTAQFSECYLAACLGKPPAVPRTPPFGQHIRWLQKQDLGAAQNYWRRVFSGLQAGTCLTSGKMTVTAAQSAAEYATELSAGHTARLRELTSSRRLTLNTLIQGAWALVLHRFTGSGDVVFGVTVSGRPAELPEVEKMVGLFINTVPVRVRLPENQAAAGWLAELQRSQFEARQYDYSPLVMIREWSGLPGSAPLFDTLLAFENYPVSAGAHQNATATFFERTNYPLSVAVVPGTRLHVRFLYYRELIPEEGVRSIAAQFQLALTGLADAGDRVLHELDRLTPADQALLAALNQTDTPYPALDTLASLWARQVASCAEAPAVESDSERLTYEELDQVSQRVALRLHAAGVGTESPVAILLERSVDFIVAMLAIVRAGGTYVPLDPTSPPARITTIVNAVHARLVVSRGELGSRCQGCAAEVVDINTLRSADDISLANGWSGENVNPKNAAYIMHTSGSTGTPKGIVIPHRAVVRLVRDTNYIEVLRTDRLAHVSNCAFDASTFEIWGALLNGACVVILRHELILSTESFAAELRDRHISVLFVTTALFNRLAADASDAFSHLRVLLFGGEAVSSNAVRAVLQAGPPSSFCHVYGPTESATFATWHPIAAVGTTGSVPIGKPISNTKAYVLDAELRSVPAGAVGELYLGGEGLARAYHNLPAATAEHFIPDPYSSHPGARMYKTGDQVRWCTDGAFEFVGRLDQQVKIRGHRVELAELERCLTSSPHVRQAVATLRVDSTGERSIVAYFVPIEPATADLEQLLRARIRESLPEYMYPADLVRLASLPLNGNGKIDHPALPDPRELQSKQAISFVEPRDELERKVSYLWTHVLGRERIGVHESFFEIGGHSLRATQLVSRIRRELGVELPLRSIFEHPTIAQLTERIRATRPSPGTTASITRVPRVSRPLSEH